MTAAQAERDPVERHFAEMAAALDGGPAGLTGGPLRRLAGSAPVRPGSALTGRLCLDLFDAQLASRHVDLAARWLRARGAGFYTIGSSGHESNAGVAAALRLTDPALLHYRSGAFYLARAQQAVPPRDGVRDSAEATLAVVAVGWVADTAGLSLAAANVETNHRGFVRVDEYLRTSTPHIFAAGDITGRLMLVPQAIRDGFVSATNAVRGPAMTIGDPVSPIGSFTEPEYAQVGLTEANAREKHEVVVAVVRFDSTTRTIIDGRKVGFCKLIVDRTTYRMLGCHVVGERAVEITQVAAIAIAAKMRVDELAHIPLSFPTYAGILARVAASAARELNLKVDWQAHQVEST